MTYPEEYEPGHGQVTAWKGETPYLPQVVVRQQQTKNQDVSCDKTTPGALNLTGLVGYVGSYSSLRP